MRPPTATERLIRGLRGRGISWLIGAVMNRLIPARLAMQAAVVQAVEHQTGLEIGGPSPRVFARGQVLPIYPIARRVDNVNFACQTRWENSLKEGGEFEYQAGHPAGRQFIREGTALQGIADESYDFILSSHCLEHVANPLAALSEWRRVTRPEGHLILVLPDPRKTFDHRRPVTTIEHLRSDRDRNVSEADDTHFDEVLALHDLRWDPGVGSRAEFQERVRHNVENRCVHHHVFDQALMAAMLAETGWHVLATEAARPLNLVAFARKVDGAGP